MFDPALVGFIDGLMTKAQKKGYSLWSFRVFSIELATIFTVFGGFVNNNKFTVFFFGFWGIYVLVERHMAKVYADYMNSPPMVQKLNALVLRSREINNLFRYMFIFSLVIFLPVDFIFPRQFVFDIGWIFYIVHSYLETSFFIGPNEFGRDYVPANQQLTLQGN